MADNVNIFDPTAAHAADTEFFVRRGMTKGYELLSLLAPPAYAAFAITRYGRSHVTVNRLLRATWVGGSIGAPPALRLMGFRADTPYGSGVAGGGAFEYVRSAYSNPEDVRNRRLVVTYDVLLSWVQLACAHRPASDRLDSGRRPLDHWWDPLRCPHPRHLLETGKQNQP